MPCPSKFLSWVSSNIGGPDQALDRYFDHAVEAAASVGALLEAPPQLDGRRIYLPNLKGKRDSRQYVIASLIVDKDGTAWPALTFGSFKQGQTVYWKPRDLAWNEFRENPGSTEGDREAYVRAAERLRESMATAEAENKRQIELGHAAAREATQAAWAAAKPAESHDYLARKNISVPGLRIAAADLQWRLYSDKEGQWKARSAVRKGDLLVPMFGPDGSLRDLQKINTGGKFFLTGGQASGSHFRIDGGPRVVLAEGLATGASWHQATGDTVVVCFSADNLDPVAEYVNANLVAADNDQSGKGEKAAKATGLPYLMPPTVGDDWNDHITNYGPGELLASLNGIPTFTKCPPKSDRIELKGKTSTWWNKYRAAPSPDEAARWAWAIGLKRVARVPVQQSLNDLIDELRLGAPAGLVHCETFGAIAKCLRRMVEWRQNRALRSICLSDDVIRRHRHERHADLPSLAPADYRGVILLKAPMGSGKTQTVGRPFSEWAKGQAGVFLAVCHRRSLVRELANRLGTEHYNEVSHEMAFGVKRLSTCLPSIVKDQHDQIIAGARFVFIDEIAQVLRSLDAHVTVAGNKSKAQLFAALRTLVSQAECLIGADAGLDDRTVEFIESCRPGERFRIIDVAHEDQGRKVEYGFGQDALASAYGEAMTRLAAGERLWIGCGEQTRAQEVAKVLKASGKRILLLHGNNTGHAESRAFYGDPEGESRKYDCVIHTSVISSGISIEHRSGQHFDHGLFIGSGVTVGPADALQMLARVRYLKTWTIVATPNNLRDICDEEAIIEAVTAAAKLEGTPAECTTLDHFIAGIRADDALARSDFSAGLWWLLEHQRFGVEPLASPAGSIDVREIRETLKAEKIQAILDARDLTDEEARRLSRVTEQTEAVAAAILKAKIRADMGMQELDVDVVEAWDSGRGPAAMDRFTAATLSVAGIDAQVEDLTLRRFQKARALAYRIMLGDISLRTELRITPAMAETIIGRVIDHRFMFAYLGLVPTKYAARPGEPFPRPAYPMREVGEILAKMGLKITRREGGFTHTSLNQSNVVSGHLWVNGTAENAVQERCLFYEVTAESWHRMAWWAERRNAYRRVQEVEMPDWNSIAVPAGISGTVGMAMTAIPVPRWEKPSFNVTTFSFKPPRPSPKPGPWERPSFTIRSFVQTPHERLLARCLAMWRERPVCPPTWAKPEFVDIPLSARPTWQLEPGILPFPIALPEETSA